MVGVQGFSLSPGSFSVPRERSPRSAESSKELGQKMHMYTHVSVSEAFKELPSERGKGESVRRITGGRVVEVKIERRRRRVYPYECVTMVVKGFEDLRGKLRCVHAEGYEWLLPLCGRCM